MEQQRHQTGEAVNDPYFKSTIWYQKIFHYYSFTFVRKFSAFPNLYTIFHFVNNVLPNFIIVNIITMLYPQSFYIFFTFANLIHDILLNFGFLWRAVPIKNSFCFIIIINSWSRCLFIFWKHVKTFFNRMFIFIEKLCVVCKYTNFGFQFLPTRFTW